MESLNTDKVRQAAESGKKALVETGKKVIADSEVMTTVNEATERGLELARARLEMLRDETAQLVKQAEKRIRKNPLESVAIAAGVGVLFAGVTAFALRGIRRS